jgi:lipopolysaccharide export system permease protein
MKIITKYFHRQLIGMFVMLMLVLTGLAWMMQIMAMLKFIVNYGVNLGGFLGMTSLMIPFIVSIIMPFVLFISSMFVYNKLISENEMTVLAASGMSPSQLARPALSLAGILTALHLILNIWAIPGTQAKFYDTQWELRYGLAHLKLQEAAFTEMADGLVVYVDKASGFDLYRLMLSDNRAAGAQTIVFAERGKLVATDRGLSLVMESGSLQSKGDTLATGIFDSFDMDMAVADRMDGGGFRVRRIPTAQLISEIRQRADAKQHKQGLAEICTRLLGPLNSLILVAIAMIALLRAPLLRRSASIAPAIAIAGMAAYMSAFMSATNMVANMTNLGLLAAAQIIFLFILLWILFKK